MSTLIKDLGAVSAYAYAVEKGYTGTEDEFASLMYDYTDVIQIASEARDGAVAANASAQEAKAEAQTASNTANEAANKATSKASEASASVTEAGKATNAAVAAKTAAETAQQRAETAQQASEDAQRKAEIAKNEAQENATIANNKASKASQYATTATNKASEASTSAKNAKTYSEQSQASATTANTKADEASASANSARVSADNAQQSATNAQTYMNSSSTSASKAQANAEKTQSDKEAVESAKSDVLSAVDNAQNYANSAQSASQAIQNMNVEATTLEPDSDATVEKTVDAISGAVTLTYGIPKGQVGEKGDKGDTGDSGVYIGASAPSDENVNVWIDSNGEPDDVIQIDDTLTKSGQAADAKKTGDEICDIKKDVSDLNTYVNGNIHIATDDFSKGSLQNDGSINSAQSYYASTNKDISFDYPIKLSIKEGYRFILLLKTEEQTYSRTSWNTVNFFIPANQKFKVQIGRITETWAESDLNVFSRQIDIISKDRGNIIFNSDQIKKLKDGSELLNASFMRGSLSNGVLLTYVSYRIGTPNIFKYNRAITIKAESGFRFGVHTFDNNDNYVSDSGWKTIYTVEANQGIKIVIARSIDTEDTSEIADVYNFYTKISIQTEFKDYVDEYVGNNEISLLNSPILNNGRTKLVAHMGYRLTAPENTIDAYKEAGKLGYWSIESDVQQTSDGYYVMMHDSTVDRTTDGSGNIADMTLAQIRALHIKNHTELQVPTFEEYLSICRRYGCVPQIELKGTITNTKESYEKIIGIVKSFGFSDKSVMFSGSKWALSYFKQASESIPYMVIYQYNPSSQYDWNTEFAFCSRYKYVGMCWDLGLGLTFEQCEQAHKNDMIINAFITDTDSDVATAFLNGADCCTTNVVLPND